MAKNVCIIPAYNRPEYLFVTVELLKNIKMAKDIHYVFALDMGYSKKCEEIVHDKMKGFASYEILHNNGLKYGASKQSFNLLESYRHACKITDKYVFLVEDDIFCGQTFFTTHIAIHEREPDLFCTIGSKLHNYNFISKGKEQTMNKTTYQTSNDSIYQSWGVCFRKEVLQKYILPHATPQFYSSPNKYCQQHFPKHFLKGSFTEQDGLIRRCCDTSGLKVGYPDYPRCYHAGIWSYHRLGEKTYNWTYTRKLQFILDTCFDAKKMEKYNEFNDVFVADLKVMDEIN